MARLMIPFETEELHALYRLSDKEYRDPRQQAAFLIRQKLEELGLITPKANHSTKTRKETPCIK